MDLKNLKTEEIEQELQYTRAGEVTKAFPKADCGIDEGDALSQLVRIPGCYYFYGQILGEVEATLRTETLRLKSTIGSCYLKNHLDLQNSRARVTEKLLEQLINTDEAVIKGRESIAQLEGNKVKLDVVLKALKLKNEDLIELIRRQAHEEKISKLVK